MKVTVENKKGLNKDLKVFVDKKTMSTYMDEKYEEIKGTVNFKIFNKINSKIVKTGSISSSINTGSVSSLYSVDENNNFAKERIAKYLASKLYRKILLNTYTSEN